MLETLLAFAKSLLQFNYILVSRGLNVLGEFASKSSSLVQLAIESLCKALIYSYESVLNLPISCFQTGEYAVTALKEFLLCFSSKIIESCNSGYLAVIACLDAILANFTKYLLSIAAFGHKLNQFATDAISQLFRIFEVFHDKAASFVEQAVNRVLVPITQGTQFMYTNMLVFLQNMGDYLISSGKQFITLISETTMHINVIFEQLGEWITMPFTFKNLNIILESVILLMKDISSIFIFIISLFFQVLKSCLVIVCSLLIDASQYLMDFKNNFAMVTFWIIVFMVVCFVVATLLRNVYVFHKVITLLENIKRSIAPHWQRVPLLQRTNVDQQTQERIEPEALAQGDDMLARNGCNRNIRGVDEKPKGIETEENSETISQKVDEELTICIVCQDEQRSTVLLPCRHLCLCKSCAESLHNNISRRKRICPLCRKSIEDIMDVYI